MFSELCCYQLLQKRRENAKIVRLNTEAPCWLYGLFPDSHPTFALLLVIYWFISAKEFIPRYHTAATISECYMSNSQTNCIFSGTFKHQTNKTWTKKSTCIVFLHSCSKYPKYFNKSDPKVPHSRSCRVQRPGCFVFDESTALQIRAELKESISPG